MKRNFAGYIFILFLSGCEKKQKITLCSSEPGLYTASDFFIGVAVNIDNLWWSANYKKTVFQQFNSITPENIFKPSFLHPGINTYNWVQADNLANYCTANSKRLHGHTLIWHNQLPLWMKQFTGDKEAWEQLFKNHIQTIVHHFKGKVSSWDVVNEAFNEDGTLRETIWTKHIGDTYIEKAFLYAKEADPDALLFYNDYTLESNATKRRNVIAYFNKLRLKGIRIDGIGMQFHISTLYPEMTQIAEALHEVAENRYKVHISELDISVNPFFKDIEPDAALLNKQAGIMVAIALHYKAVPEQFRYGITFWGLNDANSWIPEYYGKEDYPLLFDKNYAPKPMYCQLKENL